MRPDHSTPNKSGFSLPVVIFILVVIATLAGAMARLMGGGGLSTAFEVQSTRAYLAARSGLEWAANATLTNSTDHYSSALLVDCPDSLPYPTDPTKNATRIDFDELGLVDCSTLLTCSRKTPADLHRRDGTCNGQPLTGSQNCTVSLFLLSSNATCGTGPAQAKRNLQWLVGKETE
jgi:hypothetical protein